MHVYADLIKKRFLSYSHKLQTQNRSSVSQNIFSTLVEGVSGKDAISTIIIIVTINMLSTQLLIVILVVPRFWRFGIFLCN